MGSVAHLGVADLAGVARSAYGRELRNVTRLRGGSKKGVYRLAQHLSLVEGPLRLLGGGFPHREAMREIAEHNIGRVLTV